MTMTPSWDAWQTTFFLSVISNAAANTVVKAKNYYEAVNVFSKNLKNTIDINIFTYLNNKWTMTWGPGVLLAQDIFGHYRVSNAAYVAYNASQNRYVLAIAATDPISAYDWDGEDFDIIPPVDFNDALKSWNGKKGTATKAGYLTNGTTVGVGNILNLSNSSGVTLLDYLNDLTLTTVETITVTGHSMGGALAPVLAVAMTQSLLDKPIPAKQIRAYPTAGATPGDATFASFYHNILPSLPGPGASATASPWQVWNVNLWNQFDVVPSAWQVATLNKIATDYALTQNNSRHEYGAIDLYYFNIILDCAKLVTKTFNVLAGDDLCRLAPNFLPGSNVSPVDAWCSTASSWPGCLNASATARDSFGWLDQHGNIIMKKGNAGSYLSPATIKQQIGFQHVAVYEELILGGTYLTRPKARSFSPEYEPVS